MQENAVKAKWGRGEVTFGGWLSIPSSFSAEVMAYRGFDWLCLDLQHGVIDYQVAVTMLQAISATDTVPIVRVPDASFGFINKMLDAGAMGIIVPLINTAEEARAVVAACRYFPDGSRSIGPTRVSVSAGPEYAQRANAEVACIPMIETKQALGNLDAILSVPGVDAVYVGPSDLSLTLGLPPGPDSGGAFEEARLGDRAGVFGEGRGGGHPRERGARREARRRWLPDDHRQHGRRQPGARCRGRPRARARRDHRGSGRLARLGGGRRLVRILRGRLAQARGRSVPWSS